MTTRRRVPHFAAALAVTGALAAVVPGGAGAAPAFACGQDSTLTLFGLDTAAGTALFAAPPARPGEPPW